MALWLFLLVMIGWIGALTFHQGVFGVGLQIAICSIAVSSVGLVWLLKTSFA